MVHLARKISRAKWDLPIFSDGPEDIRADAISRCLRTNDDKLSFWRCNLENNSIEDVALALASSMERIDTIHIVLLEKDILEKENILIEDTKGITKVFDLQNNHVDLIKITLRKLCRLAEHIAIKVRSNTKCYRFNEKRLVEIICRAVRSGRLQLDSLKETQSSLKKRIENEIA